MATDWVQRVREYRAERRDELAYITASAIAEADIEHALGVLAAPRPSKAMRAEASASLEEALAVLKATYGPVTAGARVLPEGGVMSFPNQRGTTP